MINNMGNQRLPKIALKSNHEDQLRLKKGWYKGTMAWLIHWEIDKNVTLQDINSLKYNITSKFKRKCWARNN